MFKSERLSDFVAKLRNSHVSQAKVCSDDGDSEGALVHETVVEALTAVSALIDSLYDLEPPEHE